MVIEDRVDDWTTSEHSVSQLPVMTCDLTVEDSLTHVGNPQPHIPRDHETALLSFTLKRPTDRFSVSDSPQRLGQMAIISRVSDAFGEYLVPSVLDWILGDFGEAQLRSPARYEQSQVHPALPFQDPSFGSLVKEREGDELREENGRCDAVHEEEVHFHLLVRALSSRREVYWASN